MVVGAINVDLVVVAERLPQAGETVVGEGMQTFGGGKGANAAVAAARAGARVHLVGLVGADAMGRTALAELAAEGVVVDSIGVLDDCATGVALIVVDRRGENQIAVGAGANARLDATLVERHLAPLLASASCVLVSTEIPVDGAVRAVQLAARADVPCILNPAPVKDGLVVALENGPILTPNETELGDLLRALASDTQGTGVGATTLAERSAATVIVTVGADGIIVAEAGRAAVSIPARRVVAVDTTGAGDTFNGVLAARLARGDQLLDAARTAVVAASLSVTEVGARAGMPTLDELNAALTQ